MYFGVSGLTMGFTLGGLNQGRQALKNTGLIDSIGYSIVGGFCGGVIGGVIGVFTPVWIPFLAINWVCNGFSFKTASEKYRKKHNDRWLQ